MSHAEKDASRLRGLLPERVPVFQTNSYGDQGYLRKLSPASVLSLELQGGPFTESEAHAFELWPYRLCAVRLRVWDDMAKVPGLEVPGLEHYRQMLYRQSIQQTLKE